MTLRRISEKDIGRIIGAARRAPGLVALYLAGSAAAGRSTPISDIDFAVWMDPSLSPEQRHQQRLDLLLNLNTILGRNDVDLAVLNDTAPVARYHLLRGSRRLFAADEQQRTTLEVQALKSYLDWLPSLRLHQEALKKRIESGSFANGR